MTRLGPGILTIVVLPLIGLVAGVRGLVRLVDQVSVAFWRER